LNRSHGGAACPLAAAPVEFLYTGGPTCRVSLAPSASSPSSPLREAAFVRFQVHSGEAQVKKGENRLFMLSGKKTEMSWYCGDSKERCANDKPFNWVRISRLPNGRIAWTFYRHD
jgi:hypothetical protein